MDEQFDNKLTNHIRKVFDNYEHPGAEHGWEQLKKQFPAQEKGRKLAWLWWSSAAAVILIFLGVGLWYNNPGTAVNNMAVKPAAKQQQPSITHDTTVTQGASELNTPKPVIASNNPPRATHKNIPFSADGNRIAVTPNAFDASVKQPVQNTNTFVGHPQPTFIAAQPTPAAQLNTAPTNNTRVAVDSQKVNNNVDNQPQIARTQPLATNGATQLAAVDTKNEVATPSGKKTMADMFEEDKHRQTAKKANSDNDNSKKVNFSIYAATYFNYAEGSTNQINAGAGFTSDFRLSKNLKLSTGVALAQNSLSYNTAAPQPSNAAVFAAAPPLKQESLFGTAALVPVFKNYNASLVGLDIPINIKYEFNPQKSDAYISAGLSSGTFIDESYTYRYGYSNGTSAASNMQTERTAHNSFNNFYFAKTLNLSFGLGYPIGSNRLIVEPFVKYPLGGLGAQDIRFGAGGVNLKFSFKPRKK